MPHTNDLVNIIDWVPYTVKTANSVRDGTGTPNWVFKPQQKTVFFRRVRLQPLGTNDATVARLFINNGNDHSVAANNYLFDEVTCQQTALSEVAQLTYVPITVNLWLPAGYRINVLIGFTVAAGFAMGSIAGQYSGELSDPELYKIPG